MSRSRGRRHRSRELALRVLFEIEGTVKDPQETLDYQANELGATPDVLAFARQLVFGCLGNLDAVDAAISGASENWTIVGLGKVERAVLRLGAYELLEEHDTPIAVVIDESLELTKAYAGDESSSFVNGVLGSVAAGRRTA